MSAPPMPYFGGKQRIASQIVALFPPHELLPRRGGGVRPHGRCGMTRLDNLLDSIRCAFENGEPLPFHLRLAFISWATEEDGYCPVMIGDRRCEGTRPGHQPHFVNDEEPA